MRLAVVEASFIAAVAKLVGSFSVDNDKSLGSIGLVFESTIFPFKIKLNKILPQTAKKRHPKELCTRAVKRSLVIMIPSIKKRTNPIKPLKQKKNFASLFITKCFGKMRNLSHRVLQERCEKSFD